MEDGEQGFVGAVRLERFTACIQEVSSGQALGKDLVAGAVASVNYLEQSARLYPTKKAFYGLKHIVRAAMGWPYEQGQCRAELGAGRN